MNKISANLCVYEILASERMLINSWPVYVCVLLKSWIIIVRYYNLLVSKCINQSLAGQCVY